MKITKTFEPIRPLYAEDDGRAYCSRAVSGDKYTVYYGHWHWPSYSYLVVPGTMQD